MQNDTLVAVVIFPLVEKFLNEFFYGITEQTCKDFDLLIIEDGLSSPYATLKGINITIKVSEGLTPLQNREIVMNYANENNYKYLIFADADDIPCEDRVKMIKKTLIHSDLVVHDMYVINEVGEIISDRFCKYEKSDIKFDDVLRSNLIGLGNSGFRLKKLEKIFPVPTGCIAFDWWLGLYMLMLGGKVTYIKERLTKYRQYDNNTANIYSYTEADVDKEYELKKIIYKAIIKEFPQYAKEAKEELEYINKKYFEFELNKKEILHEPHAEGNVWWNLLNTKRRES